MTVSREDYLKAIYELGGERKKVATKDIAKALDISPPSVSEMLKKLEKEKVLAYEVYKGVSLTRKGTLEAIRIKKIHSLWEVFLVEKLEYDLADVHEEADLLEHITSKKLEERLEAFLEYPKVCPHGTPLYQDEYLFEYSPLAEIQPGEEVILKRLEDDKEFLNSISNLGLNIGDKLKILQYLEKEDKYTVKINNRLMDITGMQANNIYVNREKL